MAFRLALGVTDDRLNVWQGQAQEIAMRTMTTLALAALALLGLDGTASAQDKPAQPRACAFPIQHAATPAAPATFQPGRQPAMKLRAVDLKVNACSVLLAANGTVFEAPARAEGPATISPAR